MHASTIECSSASRSLVKLNILLAQVSQRLSQVGKTLHKLVEEVGKTKKLQNLTQASRSWPVDHRLHPFGIGFDAISADEMTQGSSV